jgi:pSer/pThr/pTyr-binding forkhead associated (FHA) protein
VRAGAEFMAKIEILSGKREGDVVDLPADGLDIGNRKTAKLSIRDPWISWNHAKIIRDEGRFVIEDLGSSNGTWINGKKITRAPLTVHDEILLGKTKIRYVEASEAEAPGSDAQGGADHGAGEALELEERPDGAESTMKLSRSPLSFNMPAVESGAGGDRLAAVERERDELRRMKEVLERFLDLSPAERLAATQAPGAPADDRVRQLEARIKELEATPAKRSTGKIAPSSSGDQDASEKARRDAVAKQIELEGKLAAAEGQVVDLENRVKTSAETAKKELAKQKQKLEDELATARLTVADATSAKEKAERRAEDLAKKVETAAAEANARAEKLAKDLDSSRKSAIEADARCAKLERDLDTARRAGGRMSASGTAPDPELEAAKVELVHARAECEEWKRKAAETRAEIDQISMDQIELEDELRKKIAQLESELKKA